MENHDELDLQNSSETKSSSSEDVANTGPEETFKEAFIDDLSSFEEGKIVEGIVVASTADSVFVDIGYKSEGEIPKVEFKEEPEQGKKISVMILRMENREGRLVLSKQRADEIVKWNEIQKSHKEGIPIEGKIVDETKGGFKVIVEDNFQAFLPLSQASLKRVEDPKSCIGQELLFKINRIEGKNNIVLSHRKYLEELREKKIEDFFGTKTTGDTVKGVVKDIVNYGAFVDLGGIDGLLHTNDIAWGRVDNPRKYIEEGESINCKILSLDEINRKVSLGLKQLRSDPWESFESRYKKGQRYKGVVNKLINFGAFVELEEGIEGLLHVSELSWTKRINHPNEVLKVGQRVEIMILDYDLKKKTVSLGLKQVLPNPWDDIGTRYPVGSKVKTKITRVIKFGLVLELEEGIEGFLHSDDISWTKQLRNISDIYKKGQKIDTVVLSIDSSEKKIKLGLKQLQENPWSSLKEKHPKGSIVTGKVTSIVDFGVFVQVDEDIEGLIHISQLSNERVEDPNTVCNVGDEIKAAVIDIDENKKKVTLSVREYLNHLEEKEITKYLDNDGTKTASVTLGDLIDKSKIGK
jgi:small subunit ribosomal protein S1